MPSTLVLFGGTLEYIMSLQEAEGHSGPVPVFLEKVIAMIKQLGGISTKGMFR